MYATLDEEKPLDSTLVCYRLSFRMIYLKRNRMGATLIGALVSAVLYGVMTMQAYRYFTCEYCIVTLG